MRRRAEGRGGRREEMKRATQALRQNATTHTHTGQGYYGRIVHIPERFSSETSNCTRIPDPAPPNPDRHNLKLNLPCIAF